MKEVQTLRELSRLKERFDEAGRPVVPSSLKSGVLLKRLGEKPAGPAAAGTASLPKRRILSYPGRQTLAAAAALVLIAAAVAGGHSLVLNDRLGKVRPDRAAGTAPEPFLGARRAEPESAGGPRNPAADDASVTVPKNSPVSGSPRDGGFLRVPTSDYGGTLPMSAGKDPETGGSGAPDGRDGRPLPGLPDFLGGLVWRETPAVPFPEDAVRFEVNGISYGFDGGSRLRNFTAGLEAGLSGEDAAALLSLIS